jgi:acetoacetyl-CoA synthetase
MRVQCTYLRCGSLGYAAIWVLSTSKLVAEVLEFDHDAFSATTIQRVLAQCKEKEAMNDPGKTPQLLWKPSNAGQTPMDDYRLHINDTFSANLKTTPDLQRWSVQNPQKFWLDLYSWLKLTPPLPADMKRAYDDTVPMSSNPPFFPGQMFNYTENSIFSNPDPDAIALIGIREGLEDEEILTWHQFREKLRLTASALRHCGVKKGDRVAALVATSVWAMVLFHAAASIGAIFTSISPELGLEGCVARLQQVTPSVLFVDGDTVYKGKTLPTREKTQKILARLDPKPLTYIIPISSAQSSFLTIDEFMSKADPSDELTFTRVPFNYPLLICYSSGTTGPPKCIVHQHGLIMQLKKIAVVHNSTTPADVIFQFASTSWVVFNVM